ncbi:gluconate operon transcriptional regulator [Liquorilactobacillus vini DSM 20605]|uniref:Gluconate operon transcriptional regulator n=2 Tax=Liquorilactobacillus vini TaxID=238015 RepID=A0A0R2CB12_9LACO|nr:gluconate operon transcriptional regulator [Liquorilactobacillus vini DSM 20605]
MQRKIKNMEAKITQRIKQIYPQLGSSSQKIADYLLKEELPASMTLAEIAQACQVSLATVSRFARSLGFKNFSQLKWALLHQLTQNESTNERVTQADNSLKVAGKVLAANMTTLKETFALLNEVDLTQAVKLICSAERLAFFGLGGSNIVAEDAYHKFLRVPLTVLYSSEYHLALLQASRLTAKDCAILISHTGNNQDILLLAKVLRQNQVPAIVITSDPESPLVRLGTICFYSISGNLHFQSQAFISMTSQLALTDCLYLLTARSFGTAATVIYDHQQAIVDLRHHFKN